MLVHGPHVMLLLLLQPLPKLPFHLQDQWDNPCKLIKGKVRSLAAPPPPREEGGGGIHLVGVTVWPTLLVTVSMC